MRPCRPVRCCADRSAVPPAVPSAPSDQPSTPRPPNGWLTGRPLLTTGPAGEPGRVGAGS
eukprot:260478-Prorocentrum_minimum.AAC.1